MNYYLSIFVGIFCILYGILKFVLGILAMTLNEEERKKYMNNPIFKLFIGQDATLSGKMIDVILLIFGIYSFLHGLHYLHFRLHPVLDYIANSRTFTYILNLGLGFILTIFYYLVIYTDLKIPKKEDEIKRYKLLGFCGGLLFILTVPIVIIIHKVFDHGRNVLKKELDTIVISSLISLILTAFVIIMIIDTLKKEDPNKSIKFHDIATVFAIPLNYL